MSATARARDAVLAARASYGRLLAWLAWQWRDIAAAEDALAEAFATALAVWPQRGVPDSPEGWLMTAARRNLLKSARRHRLETDPTVTALFDAADAAAPEAPAIPDDRLRLMFVCAHPAIDASVRPALMLQVVLGVEAARIARACLVSAEAMTKRLVRAKAKIRAAGIRFEAPGGDELAPRVRCVLEAIYGAYVLDRGAASDAPDAGLGEEASYLAALVAACLPHDAEALGLHALLTLCEARRPAARDASGDFVPLDRQDSARWDRAAIGRAGELLRRAAALRAPGPMQLEAAIQAAHCDRVHGRPTPWADVVALYGRLLELAPTVGARIGHAVASAQARGDAAEGLRLLDAIDAPGRHTHQPWWAARAHLLAQAGRAADAAHAAARALELTADPAVRRHLASRIAALRGALH